MSRKKTKKRGLSTAKTGEGRGRSKESASPVSTDAKAALDTFLAASPRGRERSLPLSTWGLIGGLTAIAGFFLLLKSFSIQPFAGDEFIYLFQGKLISEGHRPYADFAMAHPPLQALSTVPMFQLFGVHFSLLRLLPALWCLGGGIGLALLVRRENGTVAALIASGLYLTAHEPLRASSHFTGVNMTVALMIFTVLAYRAGWIRTAAALAAAAVMTRLYAIPGLAALFLVGLAGDRKQALRFAAYAIGIGGAAFIAVGLWAGFGDTVHNLFAYHLDKTPMTDKSLARMRDSVLFHNATLAILFAISVPHLGATLMTAYLSQPETGGPLRRLKGAADHAVVGLPLTASFIAAVFLCVLLGMNRVWMYYFIPAFPFAAIAAGWSVSRLIHGAVRLVRFRGSLKMADISRGWAIFGALLVGVFLVAEIRAPRLEARLSYFQKYEGKSEAERTHRYTFVPAPIPDFLNDWVRRTLWKDERIIGDRYTTFNFYLWHESRVLDIAEDVVGLIERETSPNADIFGDSGTVPLFALLSGRGIAGNEVDTNIQRYRSGNASVETLISNIDNYKTEMIILRRRFGVYGVPEVRALVEQKYRRLKAFRSAQGWIFEVYKRKTDLSRLKES